MRGVRCTGMMMTGMRDVWDFLRDTHAVPEAPPCLALIMPLGRGPAIRQEFPQARGARGTGSA
jgi:hypothetical protein